MHRLVGPSARPAAARRHNSPFGDQPPLATALDWLDEALPADPGTSMAGWPLLRALIPHAGNLAALYPADARPATLGRIQNELGVFRQSQGEYEQARALHQSALAISELAFGPDHPTPPSGWATSPSVTGGWDGTPTPCPWNSGPCKSLRPRSAPTTPTPPSIWTTWPSPTATWARPDKAVPLQQRALQITGAALGPDHPDTALRLGRNTRPTVTGGWDGTPTPCPWNSGPCRSLRPRSAPTTPTPPLGWTTWPPRTGELGQAEEALPCNSGPADHRRRARPRPPRHGPPAGQPGRHVPRASQADKACPCNSPLLITGAALGPTTPTPSPG